MRILMITDLLYPGTGGVEVLLEKLSVGMKNRGHELKIISALPSRTSPRQDNHLGIDIHRLYLGLPQWPQPKTWLLWLIHSRRSLSELYRAVAEFDPDVVNLHFPGSAASYVAKVISRNNKPLVVSLHGNDVQLFPRISTLRRIMLARILHLADYVTACSERILDEAKRVVGFEAKAIAIRNGVDLAEFGEPESEAPDRYIFAAGRLVFKKGFDLLLTAFAKIAPHYPSVRLMIAGGGEQKSMLERQIDDLGLAGRVDLPGHVERPRLVSLFKRSLFFVLPSRREPLGLVNLEAMAAGKAIIAFAVDGVPEIIDREVGVPVEPEDVMALAEAIRLLLEDPAEADRLGANGRLRALERHSIELTIDNYLGVYREAIEKHQAKIER